MDEHTHGKCLKRIEKIKRFQTVAPECFELQLMRTRPLGHINKTGSSRPTMPLFEPFTVWKQRDSGIWWNFPIFQPDFDRKPQHKVFINYPASLRRHSTHYWQQENGNMPDCAIPNSSIWGQQSSPKNEWMTGKFSGQCGQIERVTELKRKLLIFCWRHMLRLPNRSAGWGQVYSWGPELRIKIQFCILKSC